MENNEKGKSLVNVIPRNNNILIRIEFKASILALSTGKPSAEDSNAITKFYVAGYGPLVKDLVLNEEVFMKLPEYQSVDVIGNNNSIRVLSSFYKAMKQSELAQILSSKDNKVDVVEYAMFPEYIATGHIE